MSEQEVQRGGDLPSQFVYRGIGFSKTPRGYWLFDRLPEDGGFWSRYATDSELHFLDGSCEDDSLVHAIMCRMIDRQAAGEVAYAGDIRSR